MRHFCITHDTASLHLGLDYLDDDDPYVAGIYERAKSHLPMLTMPKLRKMFSVYNQYERLLNNTARVDMMQRVYTSALEGIAANSPARFYAMYSVSRDWHSHLRLGLEFRNVTLVPGYIEQWSGNHRKTLDKRYTNHFTVEAVHPFVEFLSENLV